jgi:hypothetical protein
MGAILLVKNSHFYLAKRGEPYMTLFFSVFQIEHRYLKGGEATGLITLATGLSTTPALDSLTKITKLSMSFYTDPKYLHLCEARFYFFSTTSATTAHSQIRSAARLS